MGIRKRFNQTNIDMEMNKPGVYIYYNSKGTPIYTGSSIRVKNRLIALFYGRSDYAKVEGKTTLRSNVAYYQVQYLPIAKCREVEKKRKVRYRYNVL